MTEKNQGSTAPGAAESRILRRTRLRLVAWSGGLTLALLVALGALIYASVARTLQEEGIAVLEERAASMAPLVIRRGTLVGEPVSVPIEGPEVGVSFLGPASGTLGLVIEPNGDVIGPEGLLPAIDLPDADALAAVRSSGEDDVRERTIDGQPVRLLTQPIETSMGTFIVQVVGDLAGERRALDALRIVLLIGGLGVVGVAVALGWIYAGRALVPIRESMRRQREFAADAGHELRTPLAVLKASVADARRHPVASTVAGGPIDEIDRQADRLTDLVDELLVLARIDSGTIDLERAPVRVDEAVTAAVERVEWLARSRGVTLAAHVEPVGVVGDRRRLEQLVGILLDNAIRHAPEGSPGGEVVVRLRETERVFLSVEDHGPGVPPGDLERIFERHYRSGASAPGGAGLGLAIARWIAEAHGGSIRAENREPSGARFIVELPHA